MMRHVRQSRRELYERLDRPALKPLPVQRYEYAEWKQVSVNIGYRSALCILRLSNKASAQRLERACERALAIGAPVYSTIKTMLAQRMESAPLPKASAAVDAARTWAR